MRAASEYGQPLTYSKEATPIQRPDGSTFVQNDTTTYRKVVLPAQQRPCHKNCLQFQQGLSCAHGLRWDTPQSFRTQPGGIQDQKGLAVPNGRDGRVSGRRGAE